MRQLLYGDTDSGIIPFHVGEYHQDSNADTCLTKQKTRSSESETKKKVWVNEGEKKIGLYFARWNRERVVHSLDAELGRDKCYYKFRTNELQRQRF